VERLWLRLRDVFLRRSGAQNMVEYSLILALVVLVVIVILVVLGNQVKNMYCNISGGLGT
jgi:Flp pilus assembly pilin Flp